MITFDAIHDALSSADPYTRMDHLIRAEMSAGRKVSDIFDDLNPHVNAILDAPNVSEDGEEAFLGTLDALTGGCRSEQCYRDQPAGGRVPPPTSSFSDGQSVALIGLEGERRP